jgi:hypothetical protein
MYCKSGHSGLAASEDKDQSKADRYNSTRQFEPCGASPEEFTGG